MLETERGGEEAGRGVVLRDTVLNIATMGCVYFESVVTDRGVGVVCRSLHLPSVSSGGSKSALTVLGDSRVPYLEVKAALGNEYCFHGSED